MWEFFQEFYFTNLMLVVITMLNVMYGVRNFNKLSGLKIFILYSVISFIQGVFALTIIQIDNDLSEQPKIIALSVNIFMLFEFTIFYIFLYKIIMSKTFKSGMIVASIFFIGLNIFSWYWARQTLNNPSWISIIEAFLILIPVLFYFYECLINLPFNKITDNPNFWINVGILFLFSVNTPLFLINTFFPFVFLGKIYILNYISYILLFSCLTYAFICKTKLAK